MIREYAGGCSSGGCAAAIMGYEPFRVKHIVKIV
jgi:hypothetical protein